MTPADSAARLPGPPELLPGRPDAIVDLRTYEGAALVGRFRSTRVSPKTVTSNLLDMILACCKP